MSQTAKNSKMGPWGPFIHSSHICLQATLMNILSNFLCSPEQITMPIPFSPASHQITPVWRIPSDWKCTSLCDPVGRAVQRSLHSEFPYWFPFLSSSCITSSVLWGCLGEKNMLLTYPKFSICLVFKGSRASPSAHLPTLVWFLMPTNLSSECPNAILTVLPLHRVKWDLFPLKEN